MTGRELVEEVRGSVKYSLVPVVLGTAVWIRLFEGAHWWAFLWGISAASWTSYRLAEDEPELSWKGWHGRLLLALLPMPYVGFVEELVGNRLGDVTWLDKLEKGLVYAVCYGVPLLFLAISSLRGNRRIEGYGKMILMGLLAWLSLFFVAVGPPVVIYALAMHLL